MTYKWLPLICRLLALASILGLLTTCGATAQPLPPATPEASTAAPATAAAMQASPPAPATPAPLPSPDVAPTATSVPPMPTPSQAEPSATAGQMTVQVLLIAVGDNGQSGKLIGCGDSAVPVQVTIPATEGVLRAALNELLSIKEQYYGQSGLYNALYQSDLQVEDVAIESGTAIIELSGNLMLGGECDSPRVEAQIEETARQFSTVQAVSVFLNGEPLEEVLSLQG
jgi:hypothetical protein